MASRSFLPRRPRRLEQVLPAAEYVICYPNLRLDDALYKIAPKLKLYQLLSAGYDDVDLEAARAQVPVCNNGGANAISVSEHALMLMLAAVAPRDLAARQRVRPAAGAATDRPR